MREAVAPRAGRAPERPNRTMSLRLYRRRRASPASERPSMPVPRSPGWRPFGPNRRDSRLGAGPAAC